eukprot:6213147-Pleurochrysis_carterae.AAC.3
MAVYSYGARSSRYSLRHKHSRARVPACEALRACGACAWTRGFEARGRTGRRAAFGASGLVCGTRVRARAHARLRECVSARVRQCQSA